MLYLTLEQEEDDLIREFITDNAATSAYAGPTW